MTPKERELLQGMVNCFNVCYDNFEETVEMVGSARGLTPEEVREILGRLKEVGGEGYHVLRNHLPEVFPL
jgi:hypothetical protein